MLNQNQKILPKEIYQKRESLGLSNSIQMLSEIIDSREDNKIRKDAINCLGKISANSSAVKKECFETLENLLISDDNIEIKCEAAKSLGRTKYEKALKPLKWIIEQESTDTEVKAASLKAISNIRFEEAEINLFIKELDTNDYSIKEFIKNQLITTKPEILIKSLLESLRNEDYRAKHKNDIIALIGLEILSVDVSFEDISYIKVKYPEIILMLKENKSNLLEHIVQNLKEKHSELMESALTILKLLGSETNEELIAFLNNDDFIVKKNATQLIGKLQIKESVGSLLENLDDMYEEVSKATIEALGDIGDLTAVPELLKVLNIEDIHYEYLDLDMKWIIVDAIKKIYLQNKDASFDYLNSALSTNNDVLKESVAHILGEIGYDDLVFPLIELLKEKNLDTRKNAAIALGKIGNKHAIDPLIKILEDKYTYWLLKKVAIDGIYNIYVKNLHVEGESISEPSRFYIRNRAKLIEHLNYNLDENYKVKLSIIKFLEVFGDNTALNALLKQVNDFYRIVRIASSNAIKKIEKRLELENESN